MSRLPDADDTLDALPTRTIPAGTGFYRVGRAEHASAVFYSPDRGNRWTPLRGKPGVCYMAQTETGALAESVCRNVAFLKASERIVTRSELEKRLMAYLSLTRPVQVMDFTPANLGSFRLDAGILSDYDEAIDPPYRFCPSWASHAISLGLDGILYRSRHKIDEHCLALFEDRTHHLAEQTGRSLNNDRHVGILESAFDWAVV